MPKKTDSREYIIYRYWSPNGKSYIGQTCQKIDERSGGQGQQYHASTHFFNAINKYGWDWFKNHREILKEHLTMEEADYWETYYIEQYDAKKNGYNIQSGGGFNPAEICAIAVLSINCETKEIEYYPSMAEGARQKNISPRQVRKVVAHEENRYTAGGYVWVSIEEWEQANDELKDYYFSLKPKIKNKKRQVILLNTQEVFNSMVEAQEKTGINRTNISACCRKKIKSAGQINGEKAVWQYYDEYCEEKGVA